MVMCYCGKVVVQRTAWTQENAGRRFIGCVAYPHGCGFFTWIDDPLGVRAREVIYGLIRRLNGMEERHLRELELQEERHIVEMKKLQRKKKTQFGIFLVLLSIGLVYFMSMNMNEDIPL